METSVSRYLGYMSSVIVFLSACSVSAMTFEMDGAGVMAAHESGVKISYSINLAGWRGVGLAPLSTKKPADRFPDAKTGTARWKARNGSKAKTTVYATGSTTARATADGFTVASDVTFAEDFAVENAIWAVTLPVDAYAGGTWFVAGQTRTNALPVLADPKRVVLASGKTTRMTVADVRGRTLVFSFEKPTGYHLQDSRKWGGGFGIRFFGGGAKHIAKGERRSYAFSVTSEAEPPKLVYGQPFVITAGADWIPVDYRKDIAAGSALDFSGQGLQDAPAGKYGWTRNANGHFEFERKPGVVQRFYGVNLCFTANVPEHELADAFVARMVRFGYNTLRIHHHERDLLKPPAGQGPVFDEERMDRFDYLVAKAIEAGLYLTTDVFVSRKMLWSDVGLPERGPGLLEPKSRFKHLVAVHDGAFEDWKRFAKLFFSHVNPYTGRSYADEPALSLVSLVNEGQLTMHWEDSVDDPLVNAAYVKWLAEKRAKDPSFLPDAPATADKLSYYSKKGPRAVAMSLFMADLERRSASRMIAYLREIGVKALFTNANNGPHPATMQNVRADVYDYVDAHFYNDHPQFLEKRWALPSGLRNINPVKDPSLPLVRPAFVRIADKPMCVTEWNFSGPGQYRGVGGIMTGAFSALQDWSGLWRFAYGHAEASLREGPVRPGYFDISSDPLCAASDRASVCLFLRRDLAPLAEGSTYRVTDEAIDPKASAVREVVPNWKDAAWYRRVSTAGFSTRVPAGLEEGRLDSATFDAKTAPFACTPSPFFSFDRTRGDFILKTPRTAGGFASEGSLDCGDISFTLMGGPATVWASAVDTKGCDIRSSPRILVTHLTDVQADGNVYANETRTVLLKWGKEKPVARTGRAEVRLNLDDASKAVVWALDTAGNRQRQVASRVVDGKLVFEASIAAPSACFYYEVVR